MEKVMDPNIINYYITNCAIPSIITIENRYQIDFGKPDIRLNYDWCPLAYSTSAIKCLEEKSFCVDIQLGYRNCIIIASIDIFSLLLHVD